VSELQLVLKLRRAAVVLYDPDRDDFLYIFAHVSQARDLPNLTGDQGLRMWIRLNFRGYGLVHDAANDRAHRTARKIRVQVSKSHLRSATYMKKI